MAKKVSVKMAEKVSDVILGEALDAVYKEQPPIVKYWQVAEGLQLDKHSAKAVGQVLAAARDKIEYWYLVFADDGTPVTPMELWPEQLSKFKAFCEGLGIEVEPTIVHRS